MKKQVFLFVLFTLLIIPVFSETSIQFEGLTLPTRVRNSCNTDKYIYTIPSSVKGRVVCYSIAYDYSMRKESETIVNEDWISLIAAYGDYLYVADSTGVSSWNYKNPSSPSKSDFFKMDGCSYLCLAGEYLFASNGGVVKIFKVLSTGILSFKSEIELPYIDYVVENNGIYYLSNYKSIYICQLNSTEKFTILSIEQLVKQKSNEIRKMVINDNHLFLTSDEYDYNNNIYLNSLLQVYQINDDGSLSFIGINSMSIEFIWMFEPNFALDFDFINGSLYVSNINVGLLKYSLKDGYIPEFQGVVERGYQTNLHKVDSLHYLSINNTTAMKMMLSKTDGLKMINENKFIAFAVVNVDIFEDHQVISSIDGKLLIFEGSLCEENLVNTFNIECLIMSTFKYNDYLFVLSAHKFYVLDFSEPTLPVMIDSAYYSDVEWKRYESAEIINELLFVGNDIYGGSKAEVFDISDIHNIKYKNTLDDLTGFAKYGNYLLSNIVYDISDTSNIFAVDWISEYTSNKTRIYNNYLFALYDGEVKLFDVTLPLEPVELPVAEGDFSDFAIKDTLLYLIRGNPLRVILYSIEDPESLVCLDSIDIESNGLLNSNLKIIPNNDGFIVKNIGALSYSVNQITGCETANVKESESLLNVERICTHNELKMIYSGSDRYLAYEIMDVSGRIVIKSSIKRINENEIKINVAKLKSGVYMLKVDSEHTKLRTKIIKL
ncbi:MAG: T9SS type A sorting domain-containing protein [bacterium]